MEPYIQNRWDLHEKTDCISFADCAFAYGLRAEAIRKEVYESAQTALENGFYQEAAMILSLQDYEDGEDLASYASALHLAYGNKASYAQKIKAAELLELMPQVRDSAEQARKIRVSLTEL